MPRFSGYPGTIFRCVLQSHRKVNRPHINGKQWAAFVVEQVVLIAGVQVKVYPNGEPPLQQVKLQ